MLYLFTTCYVIFVSHKERSALFYCYVVFWLLYKIRCKYFEDCKRKENNV